MFLSRSLSRTAEEIGVVVDVEKLLAEDVVKMGDQITEEWMQTHDS